MAPRDSSIQGHKLQTSACGKNTGHGHQQIAGLSVGSDHPGQRPWRGYQQRQDTDWDAGVAGREGSHEWHGRALPVLPKIGNPEGR